MNILIREIVGTNAVTLKDGQAIYDLIIEPLRQGQSVYLDFEGVKVFASPFFNVAIGQLLASVQPTALNALLHLSHLSDLGDRILRNVIDNAKSYFKHDANSRQALDAITEQAVSR